MVDEIVHLQIQQRVDRLEKSIDKMYWIVAALVAANGIGIPIAIWIGLR